VRSTLTSTWRELNNGKTELTLKIMAVAATRREVEAIARGVDEIVRDYDRKVGAAAGTRRTAATIHRQEPAP